MTLSQVIKHRRTIDVKDGDSVRHGKLKPRSSTTRALFKLSGAALACCSVATTAVALYFAAESLGSVSSNAVDIGTSTESLPSVGLGSVDGGFDMLVVGADNSADQGDAYGDRGGATLNDVNIWLHVSDDHSRATAVSFPRDLIVPHPECVDPATGETFDAMSAQPLNDAYGRGGLGCVAQTISSLTGEPFEYAASVAFSGVIAMSDAVGGVEVCLTEPIDDPEAGLILPAGTSSLQGHAALAFLRTRHGIGDGSDLARISNQQAFLSSLIRRVQSEATLTDPAKVIGLARVAVDHMVLSTSLANPITMASLAMSMKDIPLDQIVFVQYPGTTGDAEFPGKVVPLADHAEQLIAAIVSDQPFTLGSDSLGSGVAPAPAEPAPEPAPEPVPESPATTVPAAPAPVESNEPAPPVMEGLKGQVASQATCTQGLSE
ncbi:LCP family protein [Agromyces salentinus]|uniref:Cell envelope-related transcriptional attenuator domain-containing protein n=1 Tax=Agromyces salentinus TaxID=269421 RepID=A0ABP4YR59_9MICO|nr:LCP family protein [Agromyces salentinus]